MICTESDAKTKWCPQTRFVPVTKTKALSPANRYACESDVEPETNPDWARCIGSACMMWVWSDDRLGWEMDKGSTDTRDDFHPNKRRGTCGLIHRSAP